MRKNALYKKNGKNPKLHLRTNTRLLHVLLTIQKMSGITLIRLALKTLSPRNGIMSF